LGLIDGEYLPDDGRQWCSNGGIGIDGSHRGGGGIDGAYCVTLRTTTVEHRAHATTLRTGPKRRPRLIAHGDSLLYV
jgi:hypothetical protein